MRKQITRVSPVQTAKVFALVYFVVALPIGLLMLVPMLLAHGAKPPPMLLLGMPFLYGAVGFVFTLFGAWVYNLVAKYTGGIEYTSIELPNA